MTISLSLLQASGFKDIKARKEKGRIEDTEQWSEERKRGYAVELQQEEQMAREEKIGTANSEQHYGLTIAREFLDDNGVSYNVKSENFRKLGYFFSKAIHEFTQQNLLEWQGKQYIPSGFAVANNGSFAPKKSVSMGRLIEEFLSDPTLNRSKSTKTNYLIITRAINEVIGSKTLVQDVTREQCKEIGRLLIKFPKNAFKRTEVKTIAGAIKIGEKLKLPIVSEGTYNMYMQKLSAVMEYAVSETYIQSNPAKKLSIPNKTKKKDKRNPFSREQLQAIFSSDLYLKQKETASKYDHKLDAKHVYTRFWIPLISLWTGMRLNEICQLHTNDVEVIDAVPVIIVRESDGDDEDAETNKRVKTESGIRFVPIHPILIEIGFLDYVNSIKEAKKMRIFPDITIDTRGYYSSVFSKWFSRYLEEVEAKTEKTSFHSFRHTYRDAIRKAKLPRDAGLQLGGWSSGATDDNYGSGLGARDLYEEICKIKYDDLDLSHLYK